MAALLWCCVNVNLLTPDSVIESKPAGYNVHTAADREAMLGAMGLDSIERLFDDIPATVRLQRELDLPPVLSEWALLRDVRAMAGLNASTLTHGCFLGGGVYDHHIPAVVDAIASRGEFLTAYTPYQPEMSQGLLQALYEFQTLAGALLGLDRVNCSVYDGATALAEACWMMCSASGKRCVVVTQALWAHYQEVLTGYLAPRGVTIRFFGASADTGLADFDALRASLAGGDVAGVVLQTPNALGVVEDVEGAAGLCRDRGVTLCALVNPLLCGWIDPPGQCGADLVVCEGQALGLPLNAGGPLIGIMACTPALERYLPGRLVGRVHDLNGQLAYALIREDREQHVARDKATSHICSNQALNALRVAVHLGTLGGANFMRLAQVNASLAHQLQGLMIQLPGVRALRSGVFFNEFSLELPVPAADFCRAMRERGYFAGLVLDPVLAGHDRGLLVAVTETKQADDLQTYAVNARAVLESLR